MTHEAGYPLDRAPGARGGADSDVVDTRSALHPTAVHAPSLVPLRAAHDDTWRGISGGKGLGCALAVGQGRRLRLLGRLPCSASFAVCCGRVCPVALAWPLAVFAMSRLHCCSRFLYDNGPERNFQCDRIGGCAPAPVMSSISTSCCAWPACVDPFA